MQMQQPCRCGPAAAEGTFMHAAEACARTPAIRSSRKVAAVLNPIDYHEVSE